MKTSYEFKDEEQPSAAALYLLALLLVAEHAFSETEPEQFIIESVNKHEAYTWRIGGMKLTTVGWSTIALLVRYGLISPIVDRRNFGLTVTSVYALTDAGRETAQTIMASKPVVMTPPVKPVVNAGAKFVAAVLMAKTDTFYRISGVHPAKKMSRLNALDWLRRHAAGLVYIVVGNLRLDIYEGGQYAYRSMTIFFNFHTDEAKFILKHLPTVKQEVNSEAQATVMPILNKLKSKKGR